MMWDAIVCDCVLGYSLIMWDEIEVCDRVLERSLIVWGPVPMSHVNFKK